MPHDLGTYHIVATCHHKQKLEEFQLQFDVQFLAFAANI
jgi:hypothetical protein